MKYVKILGLSALMTAALMSLAGTASATVLCKEEPSSGIPATKGTVCPSGLAYQGGTEIHAVLEAGEHATFTEAGLKTYVTCEKSTLTTVTENEGTASETVRLKNSVWTFEDCKNGTNACTVTVVKLGTGEVHWTADSFHGTLTSSGTEITFLCKSIFGDIHCIYTTSNTDLGLLTGGVMAEAGATMDIASDKLGVVTTNETCPTEVKLDAKYEVTSPKGLFVAAHT